MGPPLRDGRETFCGGESAGGPVSRPCGAISVMGDTMTAAAMKPRLSLWNQTRLRTHRRGESQTRPSSLHGNGLVRRAPIPHPLPRLVGTRRGGEMAPAEILHRIRAQWPGRNPNPEPYFARRKFYGRA